MDQLKVILMMVAGSVWLPGSLRAQELTNIFPEPPRTRLEALETNIGAVLIKGTALIGSVTTASGAVSVKCREGLDTSTGVKECGIVVGVAPNGGAEHRAILDFDELDPVLNGLDYLGKVDWSVTSLSSFDAFYTTKSGLRLVAFSRTRAGTIEYAVRSPAPNSLGVLLAHNELAQFRGLIEQAKRKLDSIRK
jgi:hypothetical protein